MRARQPRAYRGSKIVRNSVKRIAINFLLITDGSAVLRLTMIDAVFEKPKASALT